MCWNACDFVRKGTKSKQGAGHVWVLADEARDEASVSNEIDNLFKGILSVRMSIFWILWLIVRYFCVNYSLASMNYFLILRLLTEDALLTIPLFAVIDRLSLKCQTRIGCGKNPQKRLSVLFFVFVSQTSLIKKKSKFSSYKRRSRRVRLQSHIWLTASSYMTKYLRISHISQKPFLIYDFATAFIWISLYSIWGKFYFIFISVFCRVLGVKITSEEGTRRSFRMITDNITWKQANWSLSNITTVNYYIKSSENTSTDTKSTDLIFLYRPSKTGN
jgi:hypothetical protein